MRAYVTPFLYFWQRYAGEMNEHTSGLRFSSTKQAIDFVFEMVNEMKRERPEDYANTRLVLTGGGSREMHLDVSESSIRKHLAACNGAVVVQIMHPPDNSPDSDPSTWAYGNCAHIMLGPRADKEHEELKESYKKLAGVLETTNAKAVTLTGKAIN